MASIELTRDDITKLEVDAIVNAANAELRGGGGVDGAIHRAGGPAILQECQVQRAKRGGPLRPGEAIITGAGDMPAKYVIHAVGPVWYGGRVKEPEQLASAYRNSLKLAVENGVRTLAFPNISTGIYRFPKDIAAGIAFREVRAFLETDDTLEKVLFVCFDDENYQLYADLLGT